MGAVGTVGAVLVALYLQVVREYLREPQLSLSLGRQASGMQLRRDVSGVVNRLRLKVGASEGRRTAHSVEVLMSAAWTVPSMPDRDFLVLDREPLNWFGSEKDGQSVTQVSLAPGVSREVSVAWIVRPLDLYETVGMSRPTDEDILCADEDAADAPTIAAAFGVFDVVPRAEHPSLFLEGHLVYKLRLDLTARDIDTVSYELLLHVEPKWLSVEPDTHVGRSQEPVDIDVSWSAIELVPTSEPFAPMEWKIAYGDPS